LKERISALAYHVSTDNLVGRHGRACYLKYISAVVVAKCSGVLACGLMFVNSSFVRS
jgi:hypothetical protein